MVKEEDTILGIVQRSQAAVVQSMNILKNYIVPTTLYMSTRLEVGRRDSFLDRMNNYFQDDTLVDMHGSRFPTSVTETTFVQLFLRAAKKDIKQTNTRASYKGHVERGSNQDRQRIEHGNRGRGGRRKGRGRRSFTQSAVPQILVKSSRGSGGGARGKKNDTKPRGRGANRQKKAQY